ncbi:helix-turn-helix domain-containing protein [Meiothermus sp. PNK-Is4]
MALGQKLRQAMLEHGDTPSDVARRTGLARSTVYAILSGSRGKRPTLMTIQKLADIYGLDLRFFSSEPQHMQPTSRGEE